MTSPILEVSGLSTRFRGDEAVVHAVNGVSFDVHAGETLGVVGESGSGKSASMLSVLRLLAQPPAEISARRIRFQGEDLLAASEEDLRRLRGNKVAMIFQDPMTSLNPVLTVGYQIMEPLRVHKGASRRVARERACELLRMVGIPEPESRLNDFPLQFSGGMRQRAMIAMALACDPVLLIADEPTTALDVTIQAQIIELAKRLRAEMTMAMVWITHDLGVVAGLADRVNVMYGGFVVETGPVDEIYELPLHPYSQALLRARPNLDDDPSRKLEPVEGFPPNLVEPPSGCPFAPRCPHVKSLCRERVPPLEERAVGHSVACWVDTATGSLR